MTLQDTLDAQMRAQLRSRYRPLPAIMAETLGEPLAPEKPKPKPRKAHLISDETMRRATVLQKQTGQMLEQMGRVSDTVTEIEATLSRVMEPTALSVQRITKVVSDISGVSEGDIVSPRRSRYMARPRQVVMYIARLHTGFSLPTIGRWLGHRDHTTIMHGSRKIEALLAQADPEITEMVARAEIVLGKREAPTC